MVPICLSCYQGLSLKPQHVGGTSTSFVMYNKLMKNHNTEFVI